MSELKFRLWEFGVMQYFDLHDVYQNKVTPTNGVSDPPIMQFTGLKDKNGKEIYASDYVKGEHRSHEDWSPIQKVTFFNGCYMFGNWNAQEYFNKHTKIEVVGNIHENPELMEVKT